MLGEALDHLVAKPATPARHHDQLGLPGAVPVKRRAEPRETPVVEREPVERLVHAPHDADGEQELERAHQPFNVRRREAAAVAEQLEEPLSVFEGCARQREEERARDGRFGGRVSHRVDG